MKTWKLTIQVTPATPHQENFIVGILEAFKISAERLTTYHKKNVVKTKMEYGTKTNQKTNTVPEDPR